MKLGIIIDNLLPSQINFDIQQGINLGIANKIIEDATIFYIDKSSMMNMPNININHVSQLIGFPGDVIATSINSFIKLLKSHIEGNKMYYVYNLEWLIGGTVECMQLYKLFRQEKVKYIARGTTHAKLIENNFNKTPDFIMSNLDVSKIYGK